MLTPHESVGARTLYEEFGLYLEARLGSEALCADIATNWKAADDKLLGVIETRSEAHRATLRSIADADGANNALEAQVRGLNHAVTALVKNDYASGLYRGWFPRGMRGIVTAHPREKLDQVEILLAKFAGESNPVIQAFEAPLRATAGAYRAAVDAREAAELAEDTAQALERKAVITWLDSYRSTYHDLKSRFIGDSAKVESFFRRPTGVRVRKASPTTDGDGAAAGGGNGAAAPGGTATGGAAGGSAGGAAGGSATGTAGTTGAPVAPAVGSGSGS